jgi:hypothetical protein
MSQMTEMANCGQINAGKNLRMSKVRNGRMTLEQQIQPLEGKDIPTFFPALGLSAFSTSAPTELRRTGAICGICAISPLRS